MLRHALCVAVAALCAFFIRVEGHAVVVQPISRNWWAATTRQPWAGGPPGKFPVEYTPHAMNAGGPDKVSNNGKLTWPQGQKGRCGDPYNAQYKKYETPSPNYNPQAHNASYTPGSTIDFHVVLNAHHWGRWVFRLCPRHFKDEKKDCILLKRVDISTGKLIQPTTPYFFPPPPKDNEWMLRYGGRQNRRGGTKDLSPQWRDSTFYTYKLGGYLLGGELTYVVRYKLPARVPWASKGIPSLIQWYWVSSNRCNPAPCVPQDWKYKMEKPYGGHCGDDHKCGTWGRYPEEFWNCADIHIKGTRNKNKKNKWRQNSKPWLSKGR